MQTLPSMADLWAAYAPPGHGYDETRDAQGQIRPYWTRFFDELSKLGEPDIDRMQQTANRLLREHGASFAMHSGRDDQARPWQLDPIPLLIDHEEWLTIDAGVRQRARLLNRVLADVYGPQELIRSGRLSPDLVLRHSGFLHPCADTLGSRPMPLLYYAADMARGPDGRMWIINDRTGIPPGAGYALENRTILAQLFPEEIRRLLVHRFAGFFRAVRAGLGAVAPEGMTGPRVVFYTPGPYSPSYFEHAYLAAYLGYTLVQGDDLVVRDGRLWLKALEGLQRVDVVMRRVDDRFCDPLELAEESLLGVPGLLEAVRNGRVTLANPIGCNVLENPGLMPFLPGLAKDLLGEELLLPTAATWWCGQPAELQYVLDHLDELVVKPIDRQPNRTTLTSDGMTGPERQVLVEAIRREPWRYIGQERVSFSTMPVFEGGRLEPRSVVMRTFTHFDGEGYCTMPGGLTRCGTAGQTYLPSGLLGGICKDTWILAPEPVAYNSLWLERQAEDRKHPLTGFFTSHAAEDLYWTGRYAERAASILQTARVLLENYDQTRTSPADARTHCVERLWQGLLKQTGQLAPDTAKRAKSPSPSLENIRRLVMDPGASGGLVSVLRGFTNAAFSVRENWSFDTWRIINRMRDRAENSQPRMRANLNQLQERLAEDTLLLQAFSGLCHESMTRTAGWLFLDLGRRVERAVLVIDLLTTSLHVRAEELTDYFLLEALLQANESLITYRRAYRTTPERSEVLSLLLLQPKNPRSLMFLLHHIEHQLYALAREIHSDLTQEVAQAISRTGRQLAAMSCTALAEPHPETGHFTQLHCALLAVRNDLTQASDRISHAHFKHVTFRPQPFTVVRPPTEANPPL